MPLLVRDSNSLVVRNQAQVEQTRRTARQLAIDIGFSDEAADEVALLTSELGTNLVRYASRGTLSLRRIKSQPGGIEVESRDEGPGILDTAQAVSEGFSSSGSMGSGLPTVRRMCDDFEIASTTAGTTILARKWLR